MKNATIGMEVVRAKGDYVVGRVGVIIEIDEIKLRGRVQWYQADKSWVSFNALEPTSKPYQIIKAKGKFPKYKAL